MLTVLIRYKNGDRAGREIVIPAKSVEFVPKDSEHDMPGLLIKHAVQAECGYHLSHSEDDNSFRNVFVMNANGHTVARYTL